jgi:hypothetical protein
LIPK